MITAYLKPTNYCNVGCEHCYLPLDVRANKTKMNDNTLHKVMIFLKEMKEKYKHDQVLLIWHGGEPLILSIDYFKNASKIIDQYFSKEELIESVQTSLIPYKKEHAEIVKERWNNEIGSSIDFNSRLIKGSVQEYQKLWLSKVDLARQDNILVMPGMVPNKTDCQKPKEIYDWFMERDFWLWSIDRYSNVGGILPDFSTNKEHSEFLIGLFDETIQNIHKYAKTPHIRTIAAAIGGVLYENPGDRWGGSCQSDFVVFNPDGKLNNCPDKDSFEASYGNLFSGFASFEKDTVRKKWIRLQQVGHRIDDCYTCENATWCKSGCPITGNACEVNGQKDECSGFKSFITHIRKFVNQSSENKEILEKYLRLDFTPSFLKPNKSTIVTNLKAIKVQE